MNKDYEPSREYTQEELLQLGVPYVLNDSCVDTMADYLSCRRYNSTYLDNGLFYKIPVLRNASNCYLHKQIWT